METVLELKDEHIEQLGVPLGHKLKIIKKIKDLRQAKGLSVPPSRQGQKPQSRQAEAATENKAPADVNAAAYDEGESHRQFQEALKEWRDAPRADSETKKVTINDNREETFTQATEASIGRTDMKSKRMTPGVAGKGKKASTKLSCWQCYKLYHPTGEAHFELDGGMTGMKRKTFCTSDCLSKYRVAHSFVCSLEECNHRFLKSAAEAVCVKGKWFCCDSHAELDPVAGEIIKEEEEEHEEEEKSVAVSMD